MLDRRLFIASTAASAMLATAANAQEPKEKQDSEDTPLRVVRVGVMGLSRGQSLLNGFAAVPGVEVKYICEVDQKRASTVGRAFFESTQKEVQLVGDFRKMLEDPELDALICAAPNHWHAPATIIACKAGKHVYVEKPCSHNPLEGEWMVAAADKFKRCVQMGTQRRSAPGTREAIAKLHEGAIGNIHLARCFYNSLRGPIGVGVEKPVPDGIDYDLWQGPAPRKPFRDNYLHYNWHWFWHWGGGELANNGVHGIDICRWGLSVDYPRRVLASGGRYWFEDDQETPDTISVNFEFSGKKQITWEALSCNRHAPGFFCCFYGDEGTLELHEDGTYTIFDRNDKTVEEGKQAAQGQPEHLQNFIDAIRADDARLLNQPILEGHKSTLLCHLGNIAYRTGRVVNCHESNGHIIDDVEQQSYWRREYDPNWVEAVSM